MKPSLRLLLLAFFLALALFGLADNKSTRNALSALALGLGIVFFVFLFKGKFVGPIEWLGGTLRTAATAIWKNDSARVLIIVAVFAAFLYLGTFLFAPLVFPESPWAYALEFNAHTSDVQVAPKPKDCDFFYAPIGLKGCHYEKSVRTIRYSSDAKNSRPIVSYDEGKTWNFLPVGQPPSPNEVYVGWDRISEGTQ